MRAEEAQEKAAEKIVDREGVVDMIQTEVNVGGTKAVMAGHTEEPEKLIWALEVLGYEAEYRPDRSTLEIRWGEYTD